MASSINASTSGAGGVITSADNSGILNIQTAGTTAVTVDASQNVGIGTASPSGRNGSNRVLQVSTANEPEIKIATTGAGQNAWLSFSPTASSGDAWISNIVAGSNLIFANGGYTTERMRIDSSGNLLVGTTSQILSNTKFNLSSSQGTALGSMGFVNTAQPSRKWQIGPDNTGNFVVFNDSATGVYIGYGGTSWISYSDERLKTDLKPIENAIEKVASLRSVTGRYKTDDESKSRAFLIAQDLQKVLPESVDDSNPDKLGVQYTDVIPLLVASIKEQQAIITQLQADVAALKGTK